MIIALETAVREVASDPEKLSRTIKLALLFGGLAMATGMWGMLQFGAAGMQRWQKNFLEETEVEMQDMLIQMPAAKLLNYSLIIAAVLSIAAFFLTAPGPTGFSWKFGGFAALVVFGACMWGARKAVKLIRKNRINRFNDQLEEALMSMGNALKAGFSINQAVEMVIKQRKNPISLEFKLMIQQTQLGVTFDEALRNMAKRMESEDFHLVASAIITARQTGGDLTGVFARLADVIRERLRIQRRIRTLTAQGRMQGLILGLLPLILLAILYFFVDPHIVRAFFSHPIGIVAAIVVAVLMACGFITIRKIVDIDI